jgi:hypothetical protein
MFAKVLESRDGFAQRTIPLASWAARGDSASRRTLCE